MPIKYKIDILPALKDAGFNTNTLRKEKILSESTIQALRTGKMVSLENIARICGMLNCQPGDILEYIPVVSSECTEVQESPKLSTFSQPGQVWNQPPEGYTKVKVLVEEEQPNEPLRIPILKEDY